MGDRLDLGLRSFSRPKHSRSLWILPYMANGTLQMIEWRIFILKDCSELSDEAEILTTNFPATEKQRDLIEEEGHAPATARSYYEDQVKRPWTQLYWVSWSWKRLNTSYPEDAQGVSPEEKHLDLSVLRLIVDFWL